MIHQILAIVSSWVLIIIEKTGYAGVFLLMALESANIPIPSEVIMPFSGFLAQQGVFNIWILALVGALGNLAGSLLSYWLGYLIRGTKWMRYEKVIKEIEKAKIWTDRFGDWAILISRVLPVVRTFISFPLGVVRVKSLWRFCWLTFAGAFIWSYVLAKVGFVMGENWKVLETYFRKFDYVILAIIVAGLIFWVWKEFLRKK